MRPVPAPGLSFPLGQGVVTLRPDGTIAGVLADPAAATSYLDGGGRVTVRLDGVEAEWSDTSVAADVDEVEFRYLGRNDLGLIVRHSFSGGWAIRVTLLNHTLEPLSVVAELAWAPAATSPARALAAGATGAYAVPGPDGTVPVLGGELVLGTCDAISTKGIGLGPITLGPLGRHVVQWRWDLFDHALAFGHARFPSVPRDLVLPAGDMALIAADDDEAVVTPGLDLLRRGGELELLSSVPQRVAVQVSSSHGVTVYDMEWVAPLDEMLIDIGEPLLAGPRNRAGLLRLADLNAAMVAQRLLTIGAAGAPDDVDDALRLFSSRLEHGAVTDGRGVAFLCGEFERLGEEDLLERATAVLLELAGPFPGLGLATIQVCMARLTLGWPVEPLLTRLRALSAADDPGAALGQTAVALELCLVAAPRSAGTVGLDDLQRAEEWSSRLAAGLGAGLPGRPVRPLPVDQQAYLATVLGLLPEPLGSRIRPDWGCRPHDVARRAQAEALAQLGRQPPRAAHSWLIMGARLA
ncbi:MAG TPA: hypothetical protein VNT24_05140 [Propionibacteriaceae bacterium]|nr:hypothetical protein [Propionibacteriaceae bacterium]